MPLDEAKKYQTIEVAPVTPVIGAEIGGIDLGTPLSDLAREELEAALNEHLVLFFRDQDITAPQHVAFGKRFGEVPLAPGASFGIHPDAPEVSVLEYDEARPPNVNHYHSDGIFRAVPEFASVLRAIVAPASGGDTIFVNCFAAYEALSDRMKRLLEGLTAVNSFMHLHGRPSKARSWEGEGRARMEKARDANPPVEHPVVRTHATTGRKSIYVSESFTTHIVGLSEGESRAVLNHLFDHLKTPEFQTRFRWWNNSVAFWDNRCTLHYALADYWPQHRVMNRISIRRGETPV